MLCQCRDGPREAAARETRRAATPVVGGANYLVDTPINLRDAIQEILKENNAIRDREIHELKGVYDAHMRTLTETIESQRDEVAQLKQLLNTQNSLLSQILHNNGITPPAAQLPPT